MTIAHTSSTSLAPLRPATLPADVRALFALLSRLRVGRLTVRLPDHSTRVFGAPPTAGAEAITGADIVLHDWRVASAILAGGDVGFGEAYMDGRWDTGDLLALLSLAAHNQAVLEPAFYGRLWMRALLRLRHLGRRNSRAQARRNIHAHYDLGNDFYRLWLDPGMTYSAAWFAGDPSRSLAEAQSAKYERILRQIDPAPGAHLLEIGGGWGGFAEHAARTRGCRVTAVSLSEEQTRFARERIAAAGLADLVRFELCDYRDLQGSFDGVASIEMFEAVGERYWASYFATLGRVLAPGARACIQTITIADERFDRYRTQSDFIQQYVFPGGMLVSPGRFVAESAAAGFSCADRMDFGGDYHETLRRWLAEFDRQTEAVRGQGFDERFLRCWRFYLAYCAAGFAARTLDVSHFTLVRG